MVTYNELEINITKNKLIHAPDLKEALLETISFNDYE
jgi:hypothetical protein